MVSDANTDYRIRVRVFVDFWNFQLTVNGLATEFRIDWRKLGPVVAEESLMVVDSTASMTYQGMNVYGSHDPASERDKPLRNWAMNTLNRFPGVHVTMVERQRKRMGPICPACHHEVAVCPECQFDMRGTEEKGVDTRIATDMIKLAWVDNYDVGVLLSSDRDFVPVVDFLSTRGIKIVHGAFPSKGAVLTQVCWGNTRMQRVMERFRRV